MKPFLLSCESKNAKLVPIAITCIQKIISHQAMPAVCHIYKFIEQSCIPAVLKSLTEQKDTSMELQLKILQTILPMVMNYEEIHGDHLAEVFP